MRMIVNRLLQAGAAFTTLLASSAMAADMPVKTYLPPPATPAFSWTGLYFGVNGGWVGANNSLVNQATPGVDPGVDVQDLAALATGEFPLGNKSGFIGGADVGYNYQFNNWVAGIEADIEGIGGEAVNGSITSSSGPLSSTLSGSMDTRWLGTIRGRLGFLAAPTVLVYGTGGLAYGDVAADTSLSQSDTNGFTGTGVGNAFNQILYGWAAGGGVEWMFTQNWMAKIEYLHYDLGTASFTWQAQDNTTDTPGPFYQNETTSVHTQGNIVRAGLNWLW